MDRWAREAMEALILKSPNLGFNPGSWICLNPLPVRHSAHRWRCASAIRSLPSVVFGPVENPPCNRQRRLPGTILASQGPPCLVLAPQNGRILLGRGKPSFANPSSAMRRHRPSRHSISALAVDRLLPGRDWAISCDNPMSRMRARARVPVRRSAGHPLRSWAEKMGLLPGSAQ
jgi:hypothetical protein